MSGIKFMGKDPNGLAKAISVNDDGVLLVELLGSLLIGEVAENPTANTILGRMKSLESKIDTLGVVIDSILAKMIDSPATEAKQAALEALVGTLTDTAVNDPTASGTIIALLKGLITQMQGDGASGKSMPVSLSGSKVQELASGTANINFRETRVVEVDTSGISRVSFEATAGMRTLLTIEGKGANGDWKTLAENVQFYDYVVASMSVDYAQMRFTMQNVGRVLKSYSWNVRGWAA